LLRLESFEARWRKAPAFGDRRSSNKYFILYHIKPSIFQANGSAIAYLFYLVFERPFMSTSRAKLEQVGLNNKINALAFI
jgi:hypothetical protein